MNVDNVEDDISESGAPIAMNELLEVKIEGEKDSTNYFSRVEDISESKLVISWPTHRGVRLLVHVNQILELSLFREGIPYAFSGLVEKTVSEPLPQVVLTLNSSLIRVQRRQNVRVKCLVAVEIAGTIAAGTGNSEGNPQKLSIKAATFDLGAGGMSIRHSTRIPEGIPLEAKLELPDNGPLIKIPCQVVYTERIPSGKEMYHMGIRFLALNESERSRIVRHVYRRQIDGIHF